MAWLPDDFEHPLYVQLASGHHLRPIRASDVAIDYPAVMGSRERLWAKYGDAWGWPPADMSYAHDEADLARHEAEIAAHETFNYAVVSWWVVDAARGSELERALGEFVPGWLAGAWGLRAVHWFPP